MYEQSTSFRRCEEHSCTTRSLAQLARLASPIVLVLAAGCGGLGDDGRAGDSNVTGDEPSKGELAALETAPTEEFSGVERAPKVTIFTPNSDSPEQIRLATDNALKHLEDNLERLGVDSLDDLEIRRVRIDELGMAHVRLQQTWKGVEVFEGEIIVHLDKTGTPVDLTNNIVQFIATDLRVTPRLSTQEALRLVLDRYDCATCLTEEPLTDLRVLRRDGVDHLAYRMQLRRLDGTEHTALPVIFVDANSGDEIWQYNNLQTSAATGNGATLYSGNVSLGTSSFNSTYYLEDVAKKIGTFTYNNTTSSVYRLSDTDNSWASAAAIDAHYAATKTYEYFSSVHGRIGIDGAGGPSYYGAAENSSMGLISSVVNYSTNYANAFWDGNKMTYGDGDGTTFSPLVTVDIGAHEMTHGVTQHEANLTYSGESGALNESMSDVFGAMVERYVKGESSNMWKIGEECYTSGAAGDALRYMDNPHGAGNYGYTTDDDPDHYNERYTGYADNGGVHINSGIANHAFYLAAKGGTHHLSGTAVTGMGADNAAKIWYRALATYMTASTNFSGARTATLSSATDLFGSSSTQYTATQNAWCAVGVGTCAGGGGGGGGGGSGADLLTNGTFEASMSPWVKSGTGALYTANGSYPQSGTGYPYFGNANSVTGQMYQQFTIPAAATTANVSFYLNVTSAETTTTTQYDKLFVEVRNTSGTLLSTLATYSNLNKATAGVYSQKTGFSLLGYKGQTIRLQFRTSSDSSAITTFRLDTVEVK